MKEIYEVRSKDGKKVNRLEVYTSYNKGGHNAWNGADEKRGYYLHIQPSYHSGNFISFEAFTGCKILAKEVKRASKKAEAEAVDIARSWKFHYMDMVADRNNLEILNSWKPLEVME